MRYWRRKCSVRRAEGIYEVAEKSVAENIIKTQSAEVDAVSGSTNTSNGILEAVKVAWAEAK